jgi:hypothetical protein
LLVIDIKFFAEKIAFYTNKKYFGGLRLKKENKVYFLQRNIQTTRLSNKLDYKKLGLFIIEQALKPVNYKLQLPDYIQIYPIFYILFLEPVPANTKIIIPELLTKKNNQEYKVEKVIDYNNTKDKYQYLIK